MITANIYQRVLLMRTRSGFGTAFTIEFNERPYLITARHVLPNPTGPNVVDLGGPETRTKMTVEPLPGMPDGADIAVMPLPHPITVQHSVTPSSNGAVFGQDCYFLGYPYGLGLGTEGRPELAFVKKGLISATIKTPDGVVEWYLDGHNNPGFSGGPVVFYKPNTGTSDPRIAAVISGYRIHRDEVEVNGALMPGAVVRANSGIVIATDIKHATDAIELAVRGGHIRD